MDLDNATQLKILHDSPDMITIAKLHILFLFDHVMKDHSVVNVLLMSGDQP